MARRTQEPDLIEEFESAADKLASWIATHSVPVVGILVLALAGAFAWERIDSGIDAREEAASNALDRIERWTYDAANIVFVFVDAQATGEYVLRRTNATEFLERMRRKR